MLEAYRDQELVPFEVPLCGGPMKKAMKTEMKRKPLLLSYVTV